MGDAAGRHPVSEAVERFPIHVDDSVLEDLRDRLAQTRLGVGQGEIVGLIGTNGAGKSTLMNAVGASCRPPARSRSWVTTLRSCPPLAGPASARRTFQGADLFADLTVLETVQVSLEARGRTTLPATVLWLPSARRLERSKRTEADELIALFGLGPYQDHFIDELSTGHAASSSWRA